MAHDPIGSAFLVLVAGCVIALRVIFSRAGVPRPRLALANLALTFWLALTGILSIQGFFRDFSALPPRFLLGVLPAFLFSWIVPFLPSFSSLIDRISGRSIVMLQSFRLGVEVILALLAARGALPELLTWHGRNFDVLVGLSAPIVAYLTFREGLVRKKALLIWNSAGLILLVNVVAHAILSAPTPFQVFMTEPSNTVMAEFPFYWLPTFLVPLAFFLHFVSIRKCLR